MVIWTTVGGTRRARRAASSSLVGTMFELPQVTDGMSTLGAGSMEAHQHHDQEDDRYRCHPERKAIHRSSRRDFDLYALVPSRRFRAVKFEQVLSY